MVKRLTERPDNTGVSVNKASAKRGRPPTGAGRWPTLQVTVADARHWHSLLASAAAQARPAVLKNQLTDAAAGLAARLGPRLAPDWEPPVTDAKGRGPARYRLTAADGTDTVIVGRRAAAAAMGMTDGSLAVTLAKGGGSYSRGRGEHRVTITALGTTLA
jgi:hypothetical protein